MRCARRKQTRGASCFGLKWVVMMLLGAGSLGHAGVGLAVFDRAVLAAPSRGTSVAIRPVWTGCGR